MASLGWKGGSHYGLQGAIDWGGGQWTVFIQVSSEARLSPDDCLGTIRGHTYPSFTQRTLAADFKMVDSIPVRW